MNRATSATGWVRNPDGTLGWTWNPITGCVNHDNGLCKGGGFPCYAYKLAHGRLKQRYLANKNVASGIIEDEQDWNRPITDPFYPRLWERRMYDLRGTGDYDICYPDRNAYNASREREKGVFVCDMGDLFGIDIPEKWTRQVLKQCAEFFQHRFYLLTKQPQNLIKFSPFPDNCWVGVTATTQKAYVEALPYLCNVQATIKFVSFEPLLEPIMPSGFIIDNDGAMQDWAILRIMGINWLIIGAQTKPYKPPEIAWVREIVEAADKAGVRVFLKDNLKPIIEYPITNPMLYAPDRWNIRQEMPEIK